MSDTIISVVAALIRDPDGHVLLVRKRGTKAFNSESYFPDRDSFAGVLAQRRHGPEFVGPLASAPAESCYALRCP